MPLFSDNNVMILTVVRDRFRSASGNPLSHGTELMLVTDGEAVLEATDGTRFSVKTNDVLLLMRDGQRLVSRTGRFHTLSVIFDLRYFLNEERIVFSKNALDAFYVRTGAGLCQVPGDTATATRLGDLLREMEQELFCEPPVDYVIKALVITAYAYVMRYFDDNAKSYEANKLPHYDVILQTVAYMNEHLSEPITLEALAAQAAMSRSYYCTVFKRIMGVTAWEYLLKLRVERAVSLLTTEEAAYSITEVQTMCGFNGSAAFNRYFKRLTGKSPSQYRKEKHNTCF